MKEFLSRTIRRRNFSVNRSLSSVEDVEKAWPNIPVFVDAFQRRDTEAGELVVVELATFEPISVYGTPAVFSASAYLTELITSIVPRQTVVGRVNAFTTGLFLPGKSRAQADEFVALLRRTVAENDFELEPSEWVEIRVAVGVADVTGRDSGLEPIRDAAREAEADQARFPLEWRRSIIIVGDEPETGAQDGR